MKFWRFDPDALLPGDVILEAGSTLEAHGIMIVEWGKFSHALLWLGDGNFIEAVQIGARVISFKRVIVANPKSWAVLRLLGDPSAGQAAADQARRLAHLSYDLRGAFGTKIGLLRREDRTRLFCSQLVAEAYQAARHPLVEGLQPNQVTPKVLHTRSKLEVVDHAFVELGDYDVPEVDRDAAYGGSLTYIDHIISQDALAAAVPCLPKGIAVPGNLQQLYETLGDLSPLQGKAASDALMEVFNTNGYFELIEEQEADTSKWLEAEISALPGKEPDSRTEAAREFEALANLYKLHAGRHGVLFASFSNACSNSDLPMWIALRNCHERRSAIFTRLQKIAERGAAAAA